MIKQFNRDSYDMRKYKILIDNGTIVNEGRSYVGHVIISGEMIESVGEGAYAGDDLSEFYKVVDATGKYIMPGVIDDQVHFREPGLEHKGTIKSESRAALVGGVTSYMEMPNTNPPTTTLELLEQKHAIAERDSYVNYSFYIGATNENISVIESIDPQRVCGVKVFMGSSTGGMLVDDKSTLEAIFKSSPTLVATHCESESVIKRNIAEYSARYGENITPEMHPLIRNAEACYESSSEAVELAAKFGTQLHVLHISTAKEMSLFSTVKLSESKKITAEVCVHHLWFDDSYYAQKGNFIKWNPAVKSEVDKLALIEGLQSGRIDVVATDHAPHTLDEKSRPYLSAPSGGPLVQHSLVAMLELVKRGLYTFEYVVEKMCHAPSMLYRVEKRGYLREGYFADIVVVDRDSSWEVSPSNILYKCGWSPFEGTIFSSKVVHTIVGGKLAYSEGVIDESVRGRSLTFNR